MKFPHPLALLAGCIVLAAAASYLLPAGRYERRDDPLTGRSVVVAGTYHRVAPAPVTPFQAVVAVPKGMADAGSVIFLVFLVGGAFTVVDKTGAIRRATSWLARKLARREILVIPIIALFFAAGGALENMSEEIIALVPVLLLLTGRLGFDPLVAVAMSIGSAAVGAAFSPINPFQVLIAQKLAQLPPLSGAAFRSAVMAVALAVWIGMTMRYAMKMRVAADVAGGVEEPSAASVLGARGVVVLLLVLTAFTLLVYGVMTQGWDFDQLSAMFFVMGVAAGLVGGLGVTGTAAAFAEGFAGMAYAAMLIGFARAIFVVLDQGQVIDTVVHGLFAPIAVLPATLSALAMMVAQAGIHFPVPSVSGQAVLTMPVLTPLSDLIGLPRQVTVLSYQYGAGLADLLTPTNGSLMAVIAAAGVPYEKWLKFAVPLFGTLLLVGAVAVVVAILGGLT